MIRSLLLQTNLCNLQIKISNNCESGDNNGEGPEKVFSLLMDEMVINNSKKDKIMSEIKQIC